METKPRQDTEFPGLRTVYSLAYQSGFCAAIPHLDVVPQTFTHIRTLAFIHHFVTHGTAKSQSLSPYKQIYLY